jgi:hypothetical protein
VRAEGAEYWAELSIEERVRSDSESGWYILLGIPQPCRPAQRTSTLAKWSRVHRRGSALADLLCDVPIGGENPSGRTKSTAYLDGIRAVPASATTLERDSQTGPIPLERARAQAGRSAAARRRTRMHQAMLGRRSSRPLRTS